MESSRGLTRNSLDDFYTDPKISKLCIEKTLDILGSVDYFVEPSAGNGSFSDQLGSECFACDIEPTKEIKPGEECVEIMKADFLDLSFDKDWLKLNVVVIGNPPFGHNSVLARKFIKKAMTFSNNIAFILPLSFKKLSMQRVFDLDFHLLYQLDLPEDSFSVKGMKCKVPCVFQIWKRMSVLRIVPKAELSEDFYFVKKTESPDVAIRRVGGTAGTLTRGIELCKPNCFHFLKLRIPLETFQDKVKRITWEHDTVGPRSIGKEEFLLRYGEL